MSYDRTQVDLTNCDREPIHIPGAIQSYGALLAVDPSTGIVKYASANIDSYFGTADSAVIGRELSDVIGHENAHNINNASMRAGAGHIAAVVLRASPGEKLPEVDIIVHRYNDLLFVELEKPASAEDTEVALHLTRSLMNRVEKETQLDPLVKSVVKLVRAMLGYDRVMVYQFLHNGAGRVIAEAKDAQFESFLGQHFPFSDIPVQARKLYLENWTRVIGDVDAAPVPLMPVLEAGEPPVDLSHAHLRSVSPIHCQYLRNMGVAASMSISIVVNGELWGLIACHHNTPKVLSIPLRVSAELFAQYFSLHVATIEHRASKLVTANTRLKLDAIVADIDSSAPMQRTLGENLRSFRALLKCDGTAVWFAGEWSSTGMVPGRDDVPELMALISDKARADIWNTNELKSHLPDSHAYDDRVTGVLAVPVSSTGDYMLFFRSEEAHEIEWAGEPVKNIVSTPSGERLTPRGSFDTWREDVRHKSTPWTTDDLAIADTIRSYLREVLLHHRDATEEQRERRENQRSLLNAELNHRVKNILALVKSIAVQTGTNAATVEEYADSFEGRLRALSYAHDQSFSGHEGGELRPLIEAEAGMHRFAKSPERIILSGPPVGLSERAFGVFALLLHEMMTNAAKYGSLSTHSGNLQITWDLEASGNCVIEWQEGGGPEVVQPSRKGFGSTLIEKTISHDLGGSVEMKFDRSGLRARFVIPAGHLRQVTERKAAPPEAGLVERPLDGMRVLLVEDQALIAMDTEELLKALGALEVSVTASVSAALDVISVTDPDCAVLDLNLGKETSEVIAHELRARKVPYVFATGYRDSVNIPAAFSEIPVVRKPISQDGLSRELSQALAVRTMPGSI